MKTAEAGTDLQKGSAEKSRDAERWLTNEASAGKTWAVFYLGDAYLGGNHGRAMPLRAANAPVEALPYYNACNQILNYGPPLGKAEEARALIAKAANNDPRSLAVLGIMTLAGVPGAQDKESGLQFLQKASDQGDLLAKAFLARQERQSNPQKARTLAKEAADGRNGIGTEEMAKLLESGAGGPADPKGAMECRVKAADLGMFASMKAVGGWVLSNLVDINAEKKRIDFFPDVFDKAVTETGLCVAESESRLGRADADSTLAQTLESNLTSKSPGMSLVAGLYQDAARSGSASAMYSFGFLYYEGSGVPKNESLAFEWWEKGARLGRVDCYGRIQMLAEDGDAKAKTVLDSLQRDGVPIEEKKVAAYIGEARKEADFKHEMEEEQAFSKKAVELYDAELAKIDKEKKAAIEKIESEIRNTPRTLDGRVVLENDNGSLDSFGVVCDPKEDSIDLVDKRPLTAAEKSLMLYDVPFWLDADKGDREAQYKVAELFLEKRHEYAAKAVPWAMKSAEQGYPEAIRLLRSLANDEDDSVARGAQEALKSLGQDY